MNSPRAAVFASPPGGCSERAWCTNGRDDAHLEVHASDKLPIEALGWTVQLVEERGTKPVLTIEGAALHQRFQVDLDVVGAFTLATALDSTAGRQVVARLLGDFGPIGL